MYKTRIRLLLAALALVFVPIQSASAQSTADRVNQEFLPHIERGEWREVLELARRYQNHPVYRDRVTRIMIRLAVMRALGELGQDGGNERNDAEVLQIYEESMSEARRDVNRAIINNSMALYYERTNRAGIALPYLQRSSDFYLTQGLPYERFMTLSYLGSTYLTIGNRAAVDDLYAQAFALGRLYFANPIAEAHGISPVQQWQGYQNFLGLYMDYAGARGDVEGVNDAWRERRGVEARLYPNFRRAQGDADILETRVRVARAFIDANRPDLALESIAVLRRSMRSDSVLRDATDCAEVEAHLNAREAYSTEMARTCVAGFIRGMAREKGPITGIGRIAERTGDAASAMRIYEREMSLAERIRESFPTSARAGTLDFREFISAYHGAARISALRAVQSGAAADYFDALAMSERARARQLSDTLASQPFADGAAYSAQAARLPEGVVLLGISASDLGVIVTAHNAHERRIALVDMPLGELELEVSDLRADLIDPNSDQAALGSRLQALGQKLLGPLREIVRPNDRIFAVVDGPLAVVPLGLLGIGAGEWAPVGLEHDLALVPSFALLSQATAAPAQARLLAIGDPAYPSRLRLPLSQANASVRRQLTRSGVSRDGDGLLFANLPETRAEIASIAGLFDPGAQRVLLGRDASESQLGQVNLSEYGYVHFATHGVLGGEAPGLSEPALILAGERGGDSLLRASEIRQWRMGPALVMLSACNTGSGEFYWGEGVMGISSAFLEAGARDVVASLWSVDSHATVAFAEDFYRAHVGGASAAAALRRAMQLGRARQGHPYYWSAFTLTSRALQ